MTKKRYLNVLTTGDIKDTHTGKLIRGSRIGDELNKLYDENEQLKENIADWETSFDLLKHENEQLQKQLRRLEYQFTAYKLGG